jgi:hypothetical protein
MNLFRNSRALLLAALAIGGLFVFSQDQHPEIRKQWEGSRHNNVNTTMVHATVEARAAGAASCARCHSDQGFRAWLPQLMRGDPGPIRGPDGRDATVAHLAALGLTRDQVKPITCTTCHTDRGDLRIVHDTFHLPSGFSVSAVAEGALCMTCHNSRNGRMIWNAETLRSYVGPHRSAQTDTLVGKNFYFVDDTSAVRNSSHAFFMGASCTTCHMTMNPESHTFKAVENSCANCHGKAIDMEVVQAPTRHLMSRLRAVMFSRILEVRGSIRVVRAFDPARGTFTDNFAVDGNQITGLADVLTVGGQIAFRFRMADGREVTSQLVEIRESPGGRQVFSLSDPLVRAAWNYLMIEHDGSLGVHNPRWTREVLETTIAALRTR